MIFKLSESIMMREKRPSLAVACAILASSVARKARLFISPVRLSVVASMRAFS